MWKWKSISLKAPAGRTIYILYWEDNIYDKLARPVGSHCELESFSLWAGCKQPETRDGAGLVRLLGYLVSYSHVVINYDKTFPRGRKA